MRRRRCARGARIDRRVERRQLAQRWNIRRADPRGRRRSPTRSQGARNVRSSRRSRRIAARSACASPRLRVHRPRQSPSARRDVDDCAAPCSVTCAASGRTVGRTSRQCVDARPVARQPCRRRTVERAANRQSAGSGRAVLPADCDQHCERVAAGRRASARCSIGCIDQRRAARRAASAGGRRGCRCRPSRRRAAAAAASVRVSYQL